MAPLLFLVGCILSNFFCTVAYLSKYIYIYRTNTSHEEAKKKCEHNLQNMKSGSHMRGFVFFFVYPWAFF